MAMPVRNGVWKMLQQILGIHQEIIRFDASDALAVALCHHYQISARPLNREKNSAGGENLFSKNPGRGDLMNSDWIAIVVINGCRSLLGFRSTQTANQSLIYSCLNEYHDHIYQNHTGRNSCIPHCGG